MVILHLDVVSAVKNINKSFSNFKIMVNDKLILNPVNDNSNLKSVLDSHNFYKIKIDYKINTDNPSFQPVMQYSTSGKAQQDITYLLDMPYIGPVTPQSNFKPFTFTFDKINCNDTKKIIRSIFFIYMLNIIKIYNIEIAYAF